MKNTLTIQIPISEQVGFYNNAVIACLQSGLKADEADCRARLATELVTTYATERCIENHMLAIQGALNGAVDNMLQVHDATDTVRNGPFVLRWLNMGDRTRILIKVDTFLKDEEVEAVFKFIYDKFGFGWADVHASIDPLGNEDNCYFYFDISEILGQEFEGDFELVLAA